MADPECESLRDCRHTGILNVALDASHLLEAIMKEVASFSSGSFQDDFTLVVAAVK